MARGKYKMYGQYVYTDRYGQICDTSVKDSVFRTGLFSRFGGVPMKRVINQVLKMYAKAYQYPVKKGGKP